MNIIDIGTIIALIVLVLLGFVLGFGRSLRVFTKGVVGVIISVFVCASFGGMIIGIDVVGEKLAELNAFFTSKAEFLGTIHLETVVFYIVMFLVVQILRIITVKFISGIFEADNPVMKGVNKFLGMIFVPAIMCLFLLLVFAVFALFDDTTFVANMLNDMEGTFLLKLYQNNPIVLTV